MREVTVRCGVPASRPTREQTASSTAGNGGAVPGSLWPQVSQAFQAAACCAAKSSVRGAVPSAPMRIGGPFWCGPCPQLARVSLVVRAANVDAPGSHANVGSVPAHRPRLVSFRTAG